MPSAIFWHLSSTLRRRLHASLLIAGFCHGIVIGTFLAGHVSPGLFMAPGWFFCAATVATACFVRRRAYVVPLIVIAGCLLGLWRGSLAAADTLQYGPLYGHVAVVEGTVTDDPDTDKSGMVTIRLGDVRINGRHYGGKVWVSAVGAKAVRRADRVIVAGKMDEGFGAYAGSMYRADVKNVTRVRSGDVAGDVRDWFARMIRRAVGEPQASLGIGYLTGQKSALPASLSEAFVIVGLTHVVVASGYNLTVLVRLARRLFARVSKYVSAIAALGMIVCFMAVTGLSPSMSRAGLVAGLSLLAWYYGRSVHPLILLPFAAAVTLLVNPTYILGDLGWALSFTSFAGVMILAPLLHGYFFGDTKPGLIRQVLGETIAATLATLPIIVLAFGQFSNVSIPANLLVLPLIPLAMLLTFIAGLAGALVPMLATVVGMPAQLLLGYMTHVAGYFAALEWATTKLVITPTIAALSYVVLTAACVYMRRAIRRTPDYPNLVE